MAPTTRSAARDVPLDPADVVLLRRHWQAGGRPRPGALVFSVNGAPLNASGA